MIARIKDSRGVSTLEYIVLLLGITVSMPILASIVMPYLGDRNCEAAELLDDPSCFSARIGVPDKGVVTYKGIPVEIDLLDGASVSVERIGRAPSAPSGSALAQTNGRDYIDALEGDDPDVGDGRPGDPSGLRIVEVGAPRLVEVVSPRDLAIGDGRVDASPGESRVVFDPLGDFEPLRSDESALVSFDFSIAGPRDTAAVAVAEVTVLGFHADPDFVTVASDDTILVDVLANDHLVATDPATRADLTIVSVTQPPSGSGRVDIVEGRVLFSPRNDFWALAEGATRTVTFSYTVEGPMGIRASAPVTITVVGAPLPEFVKIDTGMHRSCALSTRGRVYCWGSNSASQPLGIGTTASTFRPRRVLGPNGIGFLEDVTDIAVGDGFTCAVAGPVVNNGVWCWGSDLFGQTGQGGTRNNQSFPVRVIGLGGVGHLFDIRRVVAGGDRVCAIDGTGTPACWGVMSHASASWTGTPRTIRGLMNAPRLSGVADMAIGHDHFCAIVGFPDHWQDDTRGRHGGGMAVCWGSATHHRLGNGHARPSGWGNSSFPVPVMARGFHHSLGAARRVDGTAAPYPDGISVQTGMPEAIFGPVTKIAAGRDFNCLVRPESSGDNVYCWGGGSEGNLGIGLYPDPESYLLHPSCPMGAIHDLSNVPRGVFHDPLAVPMPCEPGSASSCHSSNCNRHVPRQVVGLPGFKRVASLTVSNSTDAVACVSYTDGEVWCWGNNRYGQLGSPIGIDPLTWPGATFLNQRYHHVPVRSNVPSGGFAMISSRGWATCGLNPATMPNARDLPPLSCWGRNSPSLPGSGSLGIAPAPIVVPLR